MPLPWLLQWRFQAVLDSAVKKFDRTKIIFQWLRGGEVDKKNRGFIKYASLSTVGSQWMTSPRRIWQQPGVLKLKIINVNIHPSSYLSFLTKVFTECVYIFFVTVGCRARASVTPKLCPGSPGSHLAPQTFHLPGFEPLLRTRYHVSCTLLWLLSRFVYFNHES